MEEKDWIEVGDVVPEVFSKHIVRTGKEVAVLRSEVERLHHDIVELWGRVRRLEEQNG